MITKKIKLGNIREVEAFNQICSNFTCDMDLSSGKYYVNAKSIMGIFSLDLEMPLELMADTNDEAAIEEAFKEFLCS